MARNGDFDAEMVDISGWSYFWRKCVQDESTRQGMLFSIFLSICLFILSASIATGVIITSFDDVDQAKEFSVLQKSKAETVERLIDKGINPAMARCMVTTDSNEAINLDCDDIFMKVPPEDLSRITNTHP